MNQQQINEEFSNKIKRGIFNPVKRHIKIEHEAEDRWQDAVAQTWAMYSRYAQEKDTVLCDAILVHSCRQRATDLDRRLVGTLGAHCTNQDVMDARAYRDGLVRVYRLNGTHDDEQIDETDRTVEIGLAESLTVAPEDQWISAMDLQAWVGDQTFQDQGILSRKMEGHTTKELAHEIHLPYLVTWRKEKALGADLAARAGVLIKSRGKRCGRPRKQNEAA
mgnify:CR=1 FL=1